MKNVIITGANSGLGFETAKKIAKDKEYRLILACRTAEKAAAAKARAEEKAKAASMVPTMLLQFAGKELDIAALTEAAKEDFKANNKRKLLTELTLYFKPEDGMVYYVANGSINGKIPF